VSSAFVCSGRFRSNAQKKVLDVWLLYRCSHCAAVWKYPILSRRRVADIDPTLRLAFESNELSTAWRFAFDLAALRRSQVTRIELSEALCIERRVEPGEAAEAGDVIHLESAFPCPLRLERLLALELSLSRSELQRRWASGRLLVEPAHANALRKPVRDGQQVYLVGGFEGAAS
jgi:hypothetical protein